MYNIGNGKPVKLNDFITEIEEVTGKNAQRVMMPMQPGDVENTFADVEGLKKDYNYLPQTEIKEGVKRFVEWYKEYYS